MKNDTFKMLYTKRILIAVMLLISFTVVAYAAENSLRSYSVTDDSPAIQNHTDGPDYNYWQYSGNEIVILEEEDPAAQIPDSLKSQLK